MRRNASGFLLVEALIAIVLISLAMTAAITGLSRALKLSGRSSQFTETVLPLETLIFEVETGSRIDLLEKGGEVELDGKSFKVERQLITPEEVAAGVEAPAAAPFYLLKIHSSEEGAADFWNSELFLGQEMFK